MRAWVRWPWLEAPYPEVPHRAQVKRLVLCFYYDRGTEINLEARNAPALAAVASLSCEVVQLEGPFRFFRWCWWGMKEELAEFLPAVAAALPLSMRRLSCDTLLCDLVGRRTIDLQLRRFPALRELHLKAEYSVRYKHIPMAEVLMYVKLFVHGVSLKVRTGLGSLCPFGGFYSYRLVAGAGD